MMVFFSMRLPLYDKCYIVFREQEITKEFISRLMKSASIPHGSGKRGVCISVYGDPGGGSELDYWLFLPSRDGS